MRKLLLGSVFVLICLFICNISLADEIYLNNGDKVSGIITKSDDNSITLEHEALGVITLLREHIDESKSFNTTRVTEPESDVEWIKKVSAGFNRNRGNTDTSEFNSRLLVSRKTSKDELTFKGNGYYSENDRKMNSQKYGGSARYAFSFGEDHQWYEFNTIEADHDRFANIDWRLTPFLGLGYWFFDKPDLKLFVETGVGFEHTEFRDGSESKTEMILIPRSYFEILLIGQLRFVEEITVYPTLTDTGEYRLVSDTVFTNPITDILGLEIRWVNEYNSDPGDEAFKKHDMRLLTNLVYSF